MNKKFKENMHKKTLFEEFSMMLYTVYYKKWLNCIKAKIPEDFDISDEELYSEITYNCIYLAKLFKGIPENYVLYCNKYVPLRCVRDIWREYLKQRQYLPENYIPEYEASCLKPFFHHSTVEEMVDNVYKTAKILDSNVNGDKKSTVKYVDMLNVLKKGYTLKQSAEKLGISATSVRKMLRKLRCLMNIVND